MIPQAVLDVLACPVCGQQLGQVSGGPDAPRPVSDGSDSPDRGTRGRRRTGPLRCESGHSFDIARHGYVNLLAGRKPAGTADTAAMVAARTEFLGAGYFQPIADAVVEAARLTGTAAGGGERSHHAGAGAPDGTTGLAHQPGSARDGNGPGWAADPADEEHGPSRECSELRPPGVVVDVGAGTGYYLAQVLDRLTGTYGLAVDVSTYALRRAARAHPRMAAVGADVWRGLPLRDHSVAVLLNIFAPRSIDEFHRVLRSDGALVLVTPTSQHLTELIDELGMLSVDERKDQRIDDALAGRFMAESRQAVTVQLRLELPDVERLIRMGPSAQHVDGDVLRQRLDRLSAPVRVTASVHVSRYRPLP